MMKVIIIACHSSAMIGHPGEIHACHVSPTCSCQSVINSLSHQNVLLLFSSHFLDPPRFTSALTYSTVNLTRAAFTVSANGTPPLNFTWYLNNTLLTATSDLVSSIQGGILVLTTFPANGTTIRVMVSSVDETSGTVNSESLSVVLVTRVIRTGLTGTVYMCMLGFIMGGIQQKADYHNGTGPPDTHQ